MSLSLSHLEVDPNSQIVLRVGLVQQVPDLLHVDLDIRHCHRVLRPLVALRLDPIEDVLHRAWDDPPQVLRLCRRLLRPRLALHGVRLSSAGLAVREHRGVVPAEQVLDKGPRGRVVHLILRGLLSKDLVKGVDLALVLFLGSRDRDGLPVRVKGHHPLALMLVLHRVLGPEPRENLNPRSLFGLLLRLQCVGGCGENYGRTVRESSG